MGCILLMKSFDSTGIMNRLQGDDHAAIYNGFESSWYFKVGTSLCLTLVLSAVATNITEIANSTFAFLLRCIDRKGKMDI